MRNSVFLFKRSVLTLLLFVFTLSLAFAQERTVTGKVISEAEGALPGVNIVVQGTVVGTMSGADGSYSIVVPGPDAILVFSFISYTTQTVTVGNQSKIDVVLATCTKCTGRNCCCWIWYTEKERSNKFNYKR